MDYLDKLIKETVEGPKEVRQFNAALGLPVKCVVCGSRHTSSVRKQHCLSQLAWQFRHEIDPITRWKLLRRGALIASPVHFKVEEHFLALTKDELEAEKARQLKILDAKIHNLLKSPILTGQPEDAHARWRLASDLMKFLWTSPEASICIIRDEIIKQIIPKSTTAKNVSRALGDWILIHLPRDLIVSLLGLSVSVGRRTFMYVAWWAWQPEANKIRVKPANHTFEFKWHFDFNYMIPAYRPIL